MLDDWQRRALNLLVDQYEKSPAFREEARVHRRFRLPPGKINPAYLDDFTPVSERDRFEWSMEQLAERGLVELTWDRPPRHELRAVFAREDAWEAIYQALGRTDAHTLLRSQLNYYASAGKTETTRRFAREEMARLQGRQKARYPLEKARTLIDLVDRIEENQGFLLERELSMAFFRDSKAFEKSWRKPAVDLLTQYSGRDYALDQAENPDSEREKQALVLAAHGIEANPSYIFLKGEMELFFSDGSLLRIPRGVSTGVQTPCLDRLTRIRTEAAFVLTVENLTAYHRIQEPEGLCLFLSGFHKAGMEKLMRLIAQARPDIPWRHFGDLDPAGMQILNHLRRRTGLPISPWHMGVQDLEAFQAWGKPLEDFDLPRLKGLRNDPLWAEAAAWMERSQLKLEQEWIAWNLYAE